MPLIHWATAGHRKHTCGLDVEMGKGSRSRQRLFGRSGAWGETSLPALLLLLLAGDLIKRMFCLRVAYTGHATRVLVMTMLILKIGYLLLHMSAGGSIMRSGNTGRRWYPNPRPDKEKGQKKRITNTTSKQIDGKHWPRRCLLTYKAIVCMHMYVGNRSMRCNCCSA